MPELSLTDLETIRKGARPMPTGTATMLVTLVLDLTEQEIYELAEQTEIDLDLVRAVVAAMIARHRLRQDDLAAEAARLRAQIKAYAQRHRMCTHRPGCGQLPVHFCKGHAELVAWPCDDAIALGLNERNVRDLLAEGNSEEQDRKDA